MKKLIPVMFVFLALIGVGCTKTNIAEPQTVDLEINLDSFAVVEETTEDITSEIDQIEVKD